LIEQILKPVTALVVGLAGAWAAWTWFDNGDPLGFAVAIVVFLLGLFLDRVGRNSLPGSPRLGAWLMEAWRLMPVSVAVIAGALVVIIAVEWAIPDPPSGSGVAQVVGAATASTKEVVGAVTAAVTSFLTAAFISWTEDDPDKGVTEHIQSAFYDSYKNQFEKSSRPWLLVFSDPVDDISGWGFDARHKRAEALEAEIRKPPPPT
jgi:hypothetical protein